MLLNNLVPRTHLSFGSVSWRWPKDTWALGTRLVDKFLGMLRYARDYDQLTDDWGLGPFEQPGARFSKAPKTFGARKAIFRSSVRNGEEYTSETSCMKWNPLHIKKMRIKQLFNRKVPDFALALRARKVSGGFRETGPRPAKFLRSCIITFSFVKNFHMISIIGLEFMLYMYEH